MPRNINCIYNKNIIECINKNVERSLFGVGVRFCTEFLKDHEECPLKQKYVKPNVISFSKNDIIEEKE